MAPLVVDQVTKRFKQGDRQVEALAGVSLQVRPGQFLAIMGASGSGKSTLLHLMAALTPPDSGKVLIDGVDVSTLSDYDLTAFRRRKIGLIFQSFNLIPTLTAEENILLPLMLDGRNGAEGSARVGELLQSLGIAHRRTHRPDAMSGGEQQRVAIGRALVAEPAVILADEPTGSLDSGNSRAVCQLLRDLSTTFGKTIVMVTHEPTVASFAQEVAVLKDGHLIEQFATADVAGSEGLALRYQECLRSAVSQQLLPMASLVRKLAVASMTTRKVRSGLTIAAIALSVSLVVAVTSGYASLQGAAFQYLTQYLGSTDATLSRNNDPVGGVPEKVFDDLAADPSVRHVDGRLDMTLSIPARDGSSKIDRAMAFGIFPRTDHRIAKLQFQAGQWFTGDTGNQAVLDSTLAESLATNPGDSFTLSLLDKKMTMTVVGIVHKPSIGPGQMRTLYVPIRTLQQFTGNENKLSRLFIELNGRESPAEFALRWRPKLAAIDPQLSLHLSSERLSQLNENLQGLHLLSYLGGAVAMLASTFIIFSTLSMGVSERQRMLATLRAVGAHKKQVATLVVIEGTVLAVFGILIGVPAGWLMVWGLAQWFNDVFVAGAVFSYGGVLFGAASALLAALGASLIPAYAASRTDPLEALSPLAAAPSSRAPWRLALVGAALVAIDPILLLVPWPHWIAAPGTRIDALAQWVKLIGHFVIGTPGVLLGFFLIAPLFVWIIERLAGPAVAMLLGVRYALLRQQLSSGIWRAAGTAAALMVGLAVLIAMQINGRSMLAGWQLPDKFPDIFIITTGGFSEQQQQVLDQTPGIDPDALLPIGVASPQYGASLLGIGLAAITPDATMYIGVDPAKAFQMMQLEFRQGNPADATRLLQKGDAVIVTQEFTTLKGLGLGQKMPLMTNQGEKWFTIAGVVWSPGIDVMVSTYDMAGEFDQRTANTVFGSLADGKKYFGIHKIYIFAADVKGGVPREQMIKRLEQRLGGQGLAVRDVRKIKEKIETGFGRLLLLLSTVAFAAMAVASLGVANTIMAAIRSRQWQFGILRSIGLSRSQLLRLVLGEAILLGLVGAALGLVAGLLMGRDAHALSTVVTGYNPPLTVPWGIVAIGVAAVLGIALLASIGPAVRAAQREPLALLQAGRAAM